MDRLTWLGQNRARGGTGGRPLASNQHETPQPHRASPGPARGGGGYRRGRGHGVRHRAVRRPRLRGRARSPGCLQAGRRRCLWPRRGPAPRRGAAALVLPCRPTGGTRRVAATGVPGPAARTVALRRAVADHVSDDRRRSQPPGSRDRLAVGLPAGLPGHGRGTRPRGPSGDAGTPARGGPGPPLRAEGTRPPQDMPPGRAAAADGRPPPVRDRWGTRRRTTWRRNVTTVPRSKRKIPADLRVKRSRSGWSVAAPNW